MSINPKQNNKVSRQSQFHKPDFQYISSGIKAEAHSPVYKMHKYFARRPHNVFRQLIEFYTLPGDVVLDCFCGGGVTLFEGLACSRKVIAVDVNPLATFISDCQTTKIPIFEYKKVMLDIWEVLSEKTSKYYSTICRKTDELVPVPSK